MFLNYHNCCPVMQASSFPLDTRRDWVSKRIRNLNKLPLLLRFKIQFSPRGSTMGCGSRGGVKKAWTPGVGDGQGGLACCNSWGRKELDTTERLNWTEVNWYSLNLKTLSLCKCTHILTHTQLRFHFSLPCIGEGNGNPLQCSCLENLRDGGAWWAAVYEVAQSRTGLKRLSSSSSSAYIYVSTHICTQVYISL